MELHTKYMHQSDDKTSVAAYIDQLDAQMSQNKSGKRTEDSKSEEIKKELHDHSGEAEKNGNGDRDIKKTNYKYGFAKYNQKTFKKT